MNSDAIVFPACFSDVLPRLSVRWQNWLTVAVMGYITQRKMPHFPSRLCTSAWIAWRLMKGYVDSQVSQRREPRGGDSKADFYDFLVDIGDVVNKFKARLAPGEVCETMEEGCNFCKSSDEVCAERNDAVVRPDADAVLAGGCNFCKQQEDMVVSADLSDNEVVMVKEDAEGCNYCKDKDEDCALGCKNCKQMAEKCDSDALLVEEKKKQKKRVSPCTPFRKENIKRKEEFTPLTPKGESPEGPGHGGENLVFSEVMMKDAVATDVPAVPVAEIVDGGDVRSLPYSRHRLEMIRESYNAISYGKLCPLGELKGCTYRMMCRVASRFTDEEILTTVRRAMSYNQLNGHNDRGFMADFFYLFKDINNVRINGIYYEYGTKERVTGNEECEGRVAQWWAAHSEAIAAEYERSEAEVAAALW